MAYIQKNNPIPKTGCGRRRMERMKSPFTRFSSPIDLTEKNEEMEIENQEIENQKFEEEEDEEITSA